MFAHNRRLERKSGVLEKLGNRFAIKHSVDLTGFEKEDIFLEGTGSMVLDRDNKIAYACLSSRTHGKALQEFCNTSGYHSIAFHAEDQNAKPIYHTNVMMCVADRYVVICLESIVSKEERDSVMAAINNSGKEMIEISLEQMNHFAGNMLQVQNMNGEKFIVMSSQAFLSLSPEQVQKLEKYNAIIHSPLDTIELNGGGSARCMMAEVYLPLATKI
jgi:hypothetical protein